MSADNYLYVFPHNGRFIIVNRSASVEYPETLEDHEGRHILAQCFTAQEAVAKAHQLDAGEHWTEYGVTLHPEVLEALTESVQTASETKP